MEETFVHGLVGPREVGQITLKPDQIAAAADSLHELGIGFRPGAMHQLATAMDAIEPTVTTASVTTPVQFLQSWLPGMVMVLTKARKIDELVGEQTIGSWEDEEIVQGVAEMTGYAVPYGDLTNTPLSNWNANFERRTIVRFEQGARVGSLEEARAAKARVASADQKRKGAALQLEIMRNKIGFYGYNSGANRTYGFLNDPGLPAYVNVATGAASSTLWSSKTFFEIIADINSAAAALRTQSGDLIDPNSDKITLAVATSAIQYINTPNAIAGMSVKEWVTKTYPNMRIISAPELDAANGGANVFYMYAEQAPDADEYSTDGGQTFLQMVPAKLMTLGVVRELKGFAESYSNATAGVMCKRPMLVVRRSGI